MTIDLIVVFAIRRRPIKWFIVNDQLMAKKIEIHPRFSTPAFFAAENLTVESPGFPNIRDRYRQMKRLDCLQYLNPHAAFTLHSTTSGLGSRSRGPLIPESWFYFQISIPTAVALKACDALLVSYFALHISCDA
jgi:hypothetical protein